MSSKVITCTIKQQTELSVSSLSTQISPRVLLVELAIKFNMNCGVVSSGDFNFYVDYNFLIILKLYMKRSKSSLIDFFSFMNIKITGISTGYATMQIIHDFFNAIWLNFFS